METQSWPDKGCQTETLKRKGLRSLRQPRCPTQREVNDPLEVCILGLMNLILTKRFRTQQNLTIGFRTLKKDFLEGSRSQSQNTSGQTIYSKQKIKSLTNRGQGAPMKRPKSLDDLIVPRDERSFDPSEKPRLGAQQNLMKGRNAMKREFLGASSHKMDVAPATYHERSDT
jgi:hypothetical protein